MVINNASAATESGDPERLWNVPRPVSTFTARDAELTVVAKLLNKPDAAPVALHGMPGVGKTQLALAWAHQHANELDISWRIRAADRTIAVADLAQLADRLGVLRDPDQERAAAALVELLSGQQRWLLIFDDATAETVNGLIPHRGGSVLLTSRSPNWAPLARPMEVGLFTPEAAANFLDPAHVERRTDVASQLAEQLGYLPLALEQVRAYCLATGRTLVDYLSDYRQQRLLQHGIDESLHLPVVATVALALAETDRRNPAAAQLLMLWAQLAATSIPRDLAMASPQLLPDPLRQLAQAGQAGGTQMDQTIAVLVDLALATADQPGQLRVHQLVADILREQLPRPIPRPRGPFARLRRNRLQTVVPEWGNIAVRLLVEALPPDNADPASWDRWASLLPHATTAAARADESHTIFASFLRNNCGVYLMRRGDYAEARRQIEQGLRARERILGEEHLDTLAVMNNLATVLLAQEEFVLARELYDKVVTILRRVLGEEDSRTLTSMSNLAEVLRDQGKLSEARDLHDQVLRVRRQVLGKEHLDTLTSMNNLALVLAAQGELARARQLHEEELSVGRRLNGEQHPDTLTSMNNLALVLAAQGELSAARQLEEQVVDGRRRVLGEKHPETLAAMTNLAGTLRAQGELAAAYELHERVLRWRQEILGEKHPSTLRSAKDFTAVRKAQDDLAKATQIHKAAAKRHRRGR